MRYRTRQLAAEFLTAQTTIRITEQALADKAHRGTGPKYTIVNGRALYTEGDLLTWVSDQAARPVIRRRERRATAAA